MPLPEFRTSRRSPSLCIAAVLALLSLWWAAPASAAVKREVLLLYSLGSDASSVWQRQLAKGIAHEVAGGQGDDAPEVYDERLDVVRTGERAELFAGVPLGQQ